MDSNINPKHLEYLNTLVAKYGSRVFSMRNKKPDANNIYIGRGNGSILGNPFFTNDSKTLEDRINNCINYRRWIAEVIRTNSKPKLIEQIKNLKDKNVICWCSNGTCCTAEGAQYCHGHIILAVCDHLNKPVKEVDRYTMFSGGAYGGDTKYHTISTEYGFNKHVHYRPVDNPNCSKTLRDINVKPVLLSREQLEYASNQIYNMIGVRYTPGSFGSDLQLRNYYQIVDSDSVFAVARIKPDGNSVFGGTNTAVQLGIAKGIPVFVLNTENALWYMYNTVDKKFVICSTIPTLTYKWTGVGTRDVQSYSKPDGKGGWIKTDWCGAEKWKLLNAQIHNVFRATLKLS